MIHAQPLIGPDVSYRSNLTYILSEPKPFLTHSPAVSAPQTPKSRCGPLAAGGGERDRTDDLRLAKPALSQLSYAPKLRPKLKSGTEPIREDQSASGP